MGKTIEKKPTKAAPKKSTAKKATSTDIEKASVMALTKLKDLGIDEQLQSDLEWCLGSYGFDKNPTGLYEMIGRAIDVFKAEKAKKTKGVTAKLITDLEKAAKQN